MDDSSNLNDVLESVILLNVSRESILFIVNALEIFCLDSFLYLIKLDNFKLNKFLFENI